MQVLNRQKLPADFWRHLSISSERFLFLDYDGTIVPFDPDPNRAMADPGIVARLQCLIDRTNTRVVTVTGRRARSLWRMIPLTPAPEIWGTQGIERLRPDGDCEGGTPARPDVRDFLHAWLAACTEGGRTHRALRPQGSVVDSFSSRNCETTL